MSLGKLSVHGILQTLWKHRDNSASYICRCRLIKSSLNTGMAPFVFSILRCWYTFLFTWFMRELQHIADGYQLKGLSFCAVIIILNGPEVMVQTTFKPAISFLKKQDNVSLKSGENQNVYGNISKKHSRGTKVTETVASVACARLKACIFLWMKWVLWTFNRWYILSTD